MQAALSPGCSVSYVQGDISSCTNIVTSIFHLEFKWVKKIPIPTTNTQKFEHRVDREEVAPLKTTRMCPLKLLQGSVRGQHASFLACVTRTSSGCAGLQVYRPSESV